MVLWNALLKSVIMIQPVKSISDDIDTRLYGNKAAWLSRLRKAGKQVPDAIVFPACTAASFETIRLEYLPAENAKKLLRRFCDSTGCYSVAIRSSSTLEDGLTESMAGHFESYLGRFTLAEVLARICKVYSQGFDILLEKSSGMMAVIVQHLIEPAVAGVCFSANPLTSCKEELVVSFTQGLAADLVSGKITGYEFTIDRKNDQAISNSVPSTFPLKVAGQLKDDICELERLYNQPLDIEWCLDQKGALQYVQCRPITAFFTKTNGLLPVRSSLKNDFPAVIVNHDKVSIRLLCEQYGILISNAYLHIAFGQLAEGEPDLSQLVPSPDCVSFSAVLVFPRRLEGNIIRHFAKNDVTRKICSDRQCVRYSLRELSSQVDLEIKIKQIHQAVLANHWLSVIIIQEIFEPVYTGITMRVDRGILIELAYGHFVPKGVVPTSYYLLGDNGQILEQKEICQETAYYIENGEAIPRRVDKMVSVSHSVLASIVKDFSRLTNVKTRALEFGVFETSHKILKPYLIDLVDVSPESSISCSLLNAGILSQGVFTGRIVDVPTNFLNLDSLNEHLHSNPSSGQSEHEPLIYYALRPDIGLLRLVRFAIRDRIAFIFDEGSFLSHFAIILREKRIPAIINSASKKFNEGTMAKLDAISENLSSDQRLTPIEQRLVFSYVNPDADGIISSLAFKYLKSFVGEDYLPVCFGAVDRETEYILQLCSLKAPQTVGSLNDSQRFALVDTHHIAQLPKFIVPAQVSEIVDHHSGGNPELFINAKIRNEKVGAVCTLLAEDMFLSEINPPVGLSKAMALAIVSNTLNFSAPSSTPRDQAVFEKLCNLSPVTPSEITDMFQARSEFSGKDSYEVLQLNSKRFTLSGRSVVLVQIEAVDAEAMFDNQLTQKNLLQLKEKENVLYAAVSLVDPVKKRTVILAANKETSEVLNRALNFNFRNDRAEIDRILLRKTDFIPQLEKYFLAH